MRRSLFLALGLILAGSVLAWPAAAGLTTQAPLVAGEWMLSAVDGRHVTTTRPPRMALTADGRVSGFNGCNRFFGSLLLGEKGNVAASAMGSTKMACPPEAMALERSFSAALQSATRWRLDGTVLTLSGPTGALTLIR